MKSLKPKMTLVACKIDTSLDKELEMYCAKYGFYKSFVVQEAIRAFLEGQNKGQKLVWYKHL